MRKALSFLIAALVALSAAAARYNLWIDGIQVTTDNQYKLTKILGQERGTLQSGTIEFAKIGNEDNAYVLYLNNAVLKNGVSDRGMIAVGGEYEDYDIDIKNLKINVTGECGVHNTMSGPSAFTCKSLTVGSGSSDGLEIYFVDDGRLNLEQGILNTERDGVQFYFNGPDVIAGSAQSDYGIYSKSSPKLGSAAIYSFYKGSLLATGATEAVKHASQHTEYRLYNNRENMTLIEPAGGEFGFYEDKHYTWLDSNGQPAKTLKIGQTYPLWIAGRQVDNFNRDDILGDGTVFYNPESKVLTLHNAHISDNSAQEFDGLSFVSEVDGLKINLVGTNRIDNNHASGLAMRFSEAATTLAGDGELQVVCYQGGAVQLRAASLALTEGVKMYADGALYGFTGRTNPTTGVGGSVSVLDDAHLWAKCLDTGAGAFSGLQSLTMGDGIEIVKPAGGTFVTAEGVVADADNNVAKEVEIGRAVYDLTINGTRVTGNNRDDILGDGTLRYDPVTNTLTMDGMELKATVTSGFVINSQIPDLKINAISHNVIDANGVGGILLGDDCPTSFTGTGVLHIKNAKNGVQVRDLLEVSMGALDVEADDYGIYGVGNETTHKCELKITTGNEYISATGDQACLVGFNTISMSDIPNYDVEAPSGAYIADGRAYDSEGNVLKGTKLVLSSVEIPELWVGGVRVTHANANDILGDGKANYDWSDRNLVLNGINITEGTGGIENYGVTNLTVTVAGDNIIMLSEMVDGWPSTAFATSSNCTTTIKGGGKLLLAGYNGVNLMRGGKLAVTDGTNVEVVATAYAIMGWNDTSGQLKETLTVNNSRLSAVSSSMYAMWLLDGLEMIDCSITMPEGAVFDEQYGTVKVGRKEQKIVIIEPDAVVLQGDVDGNKVVNGSDVTALYNFLLNGAQPAGDADVDGNGTVNGSDVTALYNMLLQ